MDSTTWAGPVRVTRFIQVKWAGMAGLNIHLSGAAQAGNDTAISDGIAGVSDPSQSYDASGFANLDRTVLGGYFHPSVTSGFYTDALVSFWTGAAVDSFGSPGSLASGGL